MAEIGRWEDGRTRKRADAILRSIGYRIEDHSTILTFENADGRSLRVRLTREEARRLHEYLGTRAAYR